MQYATKEPSDCPVAVLVCMTLASLVIVGAAILLLAWLSGRI